MVELGYDALELWPPQIRECRTPQLRRRLAEHVASLGLKLVRLNAADPDYFKTLRSPADVPAVLAGLKADIDAAAELGMSQLLTYEGRRPANCGREEIFGWVLDETVSLFEQALRYARTKGVSLSVEVHPFTLGIDLDWLVALCDRLDSPDFGVVYDCCHFGVGLPHGLHRRHPPPRPPHPPRSFLRQRPGQFRVALRPGHGLSRLARHRRRLERNRLPRHHDARPVALSAPGRGLSHRRALRGRGRAKAWLAGLNWMATRNQKSCWRHAADCYEICRTDLKSEHG